ncbi:hypothetical protein [Veillonella sp.]|uniref:hypothetical protein n=1 Tax=Veillonella sp. TaxID=1926307 RepID=UPI00260105A7|nr:hypothetical protein [Veillonella sp.]
MSDIEDMKFTTKFERAADLYEVGQHQLSEENIEILKKHLATLDNVEVKDNQFIITTEPYIDDVESWLKDGFDEYLQTHYKVEEMLSKEKFLDYMSNQEMGGFQFEKVADIATDISKKLKLEEAEVLTYLTDSSDIKVCENYHLEEMYDQKMASVNPMTNLSYVEERAIEQYLYTHKGLERDSEEFELTHDVNNPELQRIIQSIDFSQKSDEYIQETLSYSKDFMEYIGQSYQSQVTDEVAEALHLDKKAVLGHFLSSYECNDGFQQVEEFIINKRTEKRIEKSIVNQSGKPKIVFEASKVRESAREMER